VDQGTPHAMLGVVPTELIGGRGTVWMLGSEDVYRYGRDLLTYGPLIIEMWLQTFNRLENIVSADNVKAIRLLRRWGFGVGGERKVYGGVPFVRFEKEVPVSPGLSPINLPRGLPGCLPRRCPVCIPAEGVRSCDL
jgi:hypothetical protein